MLAKDPYKNYQQNAILSAGPEELTTMLYNRLVKDLKLAQEQVTKKDYPAANGSICHAQDIISHLRNTLNIELEVGKNLEMMYEYMNRRLIEANVKKDIEILREITGYAEEIRDTWVQAVKLSRQGV
ncbi:flagellar export chaperone FliS [Desulforamulus ferrireducens]|uniref:Flagellar secretion chaperone FliS n=1 Tax=Desulforamulus ferrireducens TaxID=1833852 RepID=A0A1S6IYH9_9FIRM|nr:flagellar export chaperone FliS [Desulforamulus ferrireducens]AQS59833.1 flagellar export chaperone FliS [Desulforamulus ferrireducens]